MRQAMPNAKHKPAWRGRFGAWDVVGHAQMVEACVCRDDPEGNSPMSTNAVANATIHSRVVGPVTSR